LNATTWKTLRNTLSTVILSGIATLPSVAQNPKVLVLHPPGSIYATASGINNKGNTVGAFGMPGKPLQGFGYLPATNQYKIFNYPGADSTIALGINDANTVVGTFANGDTQHGFFLVNGTKFTQYDVTGSSGTVIQGINNAGDFAGTVGANGDYHGFVNISGIVTTFQVNGLPTDVYSINASGTTVGFFVNAQATGVDGFLRDAAGNVTQIDYPSSIQTACTGINDAGAITGFYTDSNGVDHGFVRVGGKYQTLRAPYVASINNHYAIVGSFTAKSGKTYGFLRPRNK